MAEAQAAEAESYRIASEPFYMPAADELNLFQPVAAQVELQ